jgi:chemotaxis protein methyltransferase CheR
VNRRNRVESSMNAELTYSCPPRAIRATLSDRDFRRLGDIISAESGIKMPGTKKIMLEARLRKRLRVLGIESYRKYCDYLFSPQGIEHELHQMIDVVTTNKTDFFREKVHFDYLTGNAVPKLLTLSPPQSRKNLHIWSAGCATGEEAYSIAMVLSELKKKRNDFDFKIVATDISMKALQNAVRGVYEDERIKTVPIVLRKKYLLRSKDKARCLVRITPELRDTVIFRQLNFLSNSYGFTEPLDIIFCRNVFIYFKKETQEKILQRFHEYLAPGGYLFMGHCETLSQMRIPLIPIGSMIYRKPS